MTTSIKKTHPLLLIAAISVIIFSGVGVAAMMGLVPNTFSKSAPSVASDTTADQTKPVKEDEASKPASPKHTRSLATAEPAKIVSHAQICNICGVVESVNLVEQKGEGSGLGAVAGGVAGALVGNQIGNGNGRTIATIAGIAGGAYAGNEIEKNVKKTAHYSIKVKMNDGSFRTVQQKTDPGLVVGDKVKIVNGAVVRN